MQKLTVLERSLGAFAGGSQLGRRERSGCTQQSCLGPSAEPENHLLGADHRCDEAGEAPRQTLGIESGDERLHEQLLYRFERASVVLRRRDRAELAAL